MLTKVKTKAKVQTWIRPLTSAKLARITEGSIRGLQAMGYDVAMRRVNWRNRKAQLPVPWFVRLELSVVVGNIVVWCRKATPGVLDIAKVSALDQRDVDGKPILGEVVADCKVRVDSGVTVITIPKEVKAVLGNVLWRFIDYGLTDYPGKVTVKVFETPGVPVGTNETLTKCLRKWPEPVLDAAEAWRIGFEPYTKAMENTWLPPKYATRDPRNLARADAVNKIMIETAETEEELRRSARRIVPACRQPAKR